MKLFRSGYQPKKIKVKPKPPNVKPEKPKQTVKLTLDETGLRDAIGNIVTSFETVLNNNVEIIILKPQPRQNGKQANITARNNIKNLEYVRGIVDNTDRNQDDVYSMNDSEAMCALREYFKSEVQE